MSDGLLNPVVESADRVRFFLHFIQNFVGVQDVVNYLLIWCYVKSYLKFYTGTHYEGGKVYFVFHGN